MQRCKYKNGQIGNSIDKLSIHAIIVDMITRKLGQKLIETSKKFPIVGILGPRQSGKTTLAKTLFPNYNYVSLESPDNRELAQLDPRAFLLTHKPPAIFDEIQKTPELFSYLQEHVDISGKVGEYVLTGSQNFALSRHISQTLAGRIYLASLPTFTIGELKEANINFGTWQEYAFKGSYPRIWDKNITPDEWYPSYIQTYLEKDVREIKNISDLGQFQTFLKLCAGRGGQELVLSTLASEIGISHNTVKAWLSILEASYVIFLLRPYYKNLNKRITKTPKIYFFDTGVMLNLLGINSADQLNTHPLKGGIFENLVVSEIVKSKLNTGQNNLGYFIRDKSGNEVDYVQETGAGLSLTEIKSSHTFSTDFLKNINYWKKLSDSEKANDFIVYAGNQEITIEKTKIINWQNLEPVISV